MVKRYISEIISKEEIIDKWKKGRKILIYSQTDTGKTYFIQNKFYEFCVENNYKTLLLSNRNLLRDQNVKNLDGKEDVFTLRNYQDLEIKVVSGMTVDDVFREYDVLVFDECHMFFSDSMFNRRTDALLESFTRHNPNKLLIFLTATPQNLFLFFEDFNLKFDLMYPKNPEIDYSFIGKLRFFDLKDSVETILQNLNYGEKAIYFASKAKDAYSIANNKFEDAAFICAEGNKEFGKESNREVMRQIALTNSFEPTILCTTKVLDNGVNIEDADVTTIIIESSDPINILQSLGRRRIKDGDEKINVYIREISPFNLRQRKRSMDAIIETAMERKEVGKDSFLYLHRKTDFDNVVDNDGEINVSKFYAAKYMSSVYRKMLQMGFSNYIRKLLKQEEETKYSDEEFKKMSFLEIIEAYSGRKLFGDEIIQLRKKLINYVYMPKKRINYSRMGKGIINAHLENFNIPYHVKSGQESSGENRNKTYWVVLPDDEVELNE
jgi:superfamily II DNA or RNA helicase